MKIYSKPKEPIRKSDVAESIELYDGDTLQDALDSLIARGINYDEVRISIEQNFDGAPSYVFLVYNRAETDEEFNARMRRYETKLRSYNKWYEENREAIEIELAERARKEALKKEKELERKRKFLVKEKERLEKIRRNIDRKLGEIDEQNYT